MKYIVINKNTGKIDRNLPIFYDDMSMPINEQELVYATISEDIVKKIEDGVAIIDFEKTLYVNSVLNVVLIDTPKSNYMENRIRDRDEFVKQADKMLTIEDLSESIINKINKYKADLLALQITNNEIQEISWPQKPW